jgi:putative tryptophan/tyrosine transport system substrate-binding protein
MAVREVIHITPLGWAMWYFPSSAQPYIFGGDMRRGELLTAAERERVIARAASFETRTSCAPQDERAGLVIFTDSFMGGHIATAIAATTRYKVPAIFDVPFFPRNGGLISYGASFADLFRHAATYVDRILKGEKPGDLPVQVPTRYELVLNVRTAKALGLDVPASLLVRADQVIE